jgi:hypothetical protein
MRTALERLSSKIGEIGTPGAHLRNPLAPSLITFESIPRVGKPTGPREARPDDRLRVPTVF